MRLRSFIIAYALVLAILLFADRRPGSTEQDRYSHVVDLTDGQNATAPRATAAESRTRIIAPDALIPGTWAAGQIPPERLVAPLVVMDLNPAAAAIDGSPQISLDDIALWESQHGMIPQGAVVAIRRAGARDALSTTAFPIARDAAVFLIDARYTIGFAVESQVNLTSDRTLAQQLALHGSYVVEGTARFTSLPATGSLVIVAPAKNKKPGEAPVRILAMVR
ncbi:MAG: cyclase family protein [Terriglobales bacterium]|jgi:kynurenine formamidase